MTDTELLEIIGTDKIIDDIPSDTIKASELDEGGVTSNDNDRVLYNNTPILNQADPNTISLTRNACGAFAMAKGLNEMNYIEGVRPQNNCNPINLWKRTLSPKYGGTLTGGSTLVGNLNNARDSGFTGGHYACSSVEEAIDAIDKQRFIYTGSYYVDWRATVANNNVLIFNKDIFNGHIMPILGYERSRERFLVPNSYGEERFDKGFNYLRFSDFNNFFSKIAVIDMKDTNLITQVMSDREILTSAKNAGVRNGDRGDSPVVYGEVAIMMNRLGMDTYGLVNLDIQYGQTISRQHLADLIISISGTHNKIRNSQAGETPATRRQAVLMLMRSKQ